jgi:hypothetical protein
MPPEEKMARDIALMREHQAKMEYLDAKELADIMAAVQEQHADEAASERALLEYLRASELAREAEEVEAEEETEVETDILEEIETIEEPEAVEPPEEPSPFADPRVSPPGRSLPGFPESLPSPPRVNQNYDAGVVSNSAVLDLVTRHIDLTAELRQAEVNMTQTKALADRSLASKSDLRAAEIGFDALQQKLDVLRRVMDVEVRAAKMGIQNLSRQLEVAQKLGGSSAEFEADIMRLEARIDLLRSVH